MKLGRVLASKYDDDGFLCVQIEVFGSKAAQWFELSNAHGQQSRPLDPDDAGSCQAYYWGEERSRGYAMLANDTRAQSLLPLSQKGEVFFHGPTGAFIRFHTDGGISLFTTDDNTVNGRSVFLNVDPTGLTFNFPYGKLTFDQTGFHVVTNAGPRLDLGALGAPAPLDALGAYATLSAPMVHLEGSAVAMGAAGGAPEPAAKAGQTLAAMQALMTAIEALSAAIGALGQITTSPAAGNAAAATAAGIVATAQAALVAAVGTIPSTSTAVT